MKLHADDYMADEMEVLDLDTGEFIRKCVWANQETGEYEVLLSLDPVIDDQNVIQHNFSSRLCKDNIVLVYKGE